MSASSKPEGSRRGKKSKEPLTVMQVLINWKKGEFQELCRQMQFPAVWGVTNPPAESPIVEPLFCYTSLNTSCHNPRPY
ncbi:hypothetical protein Hanom_Chr01g00033271 [Helianthus anomalus]